MAAKTESKLKLTKSSAREVTYIRALVHGDSGIGKTTSLRTLPEKRTLIATGERGLIPLREKDIPAARIEDWEDVRGIVEEFLYGPVEIDGERITCLAFDSLTEVSDICKRQIVTKDRRSLISERSKGKTDKPSNVYEDLMQMEDYNLYSVRMRNFLSSVVHLPVHVIFTSLSDWREDKQTGTQHRVPALSGKLSLEIPAFFDLVFHMETATNEEGESTRVFRTNNDGRVIAKDASGVLAPLEEPDWSKIFGKILNNKKEK